MTKERIISTSLCMVIASLLTILLLYKCGCCGVKCPPLPKEKTDTSLHNVNTDTTYHPSPIIIHDGGYYQPRIIHDTFPVHDTLLTKVDTAAILIDFFSVKTYSDTQRVQYGNVIINDGVTQNKIISRNLKLNQKIPEITKTEVIIDSIPYEKHKVELYAGISLISDSRQLIPGIGLMLKNKRDNVIESSVFYNKNWWYQFGLKTKIRLKE